MKDSIILTGFSGTGKSAVGREVARSLGWRFVETDEEVVAQAGKSIADIFAQEGEPRFRELERQAVRVACQGERVVVSTGGGALIDAENRELMLNSGGVVVCLEARLQTIYQRLTGDGDDGSDATVRPLLAGPEPLERIRSLKEQRQSTYALAHWTVHTDDLTLDQVATEVLRGWRTIRDARAVAEMPSSSASLEEPICVVRTTSGAYPIYVGWELRQHLVQYLAQVGVHGTAYLIQDGAVARPHGRGVQVTLHEGGIEVHTFAVPSGETSKSLEMAHLIYQWLVGRRAERNHAILALGGGVVGDLVGYVAATFLRGMPLIQMPTTLAAMTDAAIGGKVAVNLPQGKNLVGAFYQPRAVIADLSTLATLPQREQVAGWAETIKHALILDAELLEELERKADVLLCLERDAVQRVVARSLALKAGVVAEDERETTGRRTILNYGHTVGHALEAATEYEAYLHGEAVAVGMAVAAELGRRLGVTPASLVERQAALLERFGLPQQCLGVDVAAILGAMELDKKTSAGSIGWVLLEDVGRPIIRHDVPLDLVRQVVSEFCK